MELSSVYQIVIGVSPGGGGVYHQVGEGPSPNGDGTISTELNPKELDGYNPENTQDKEIQNTKISDKWWEFCKLEWFASYTARVLIEKWWKPDMNTDEFTDWIAKFMEARDITYSESDYKKWKWAFQSMFTYWDEQDKWSKKKKMWLSRMTNQKWFKFNLPFTKK